ncbi:hypothetical protein CALCODRAFT_498988 [Calocera cornea HHB12733]|uniref:Uncharacterized protein n=1 Tax=Calocera cornea HHB12733 TaxID=1353952 RepID=A0A165EMM0_9BASI|nr:hypothetical protein CALCODRAFT_498988 [Calocera cornea HHB12733]
MFVVARFPLVDLKMELCSLGTVASANVDATALLPLINTVGSKSTTFALRAPNAHHSGNLLFPLLHKVQRIALQIGTTCPNIVVSFPRTLEELQVAFDVEAQPPPPIIKFLKELPMVEEILSLHVVRLT